MNKGPKRQHKGGTNQDIDLTNNEESLIDRPEETSPSMSERSEETENTSLTQLVKDDGEITKEFTDGDDPNFDSL